MLILDDKSCYLFDDATWFEAVIGRERRAANQNQSSSSQWWRPGAAGVTHLCGNAAGVRDAARQRASRGAVVVHVDGPVGVLLTSAALILPQGGENVKLETWWWGRSTCTPEVTWAKNEKKWDNMKKSRRKTWRNEIHLLSACNYETDWCLHSADFVKQPEKVVTVTEIQVTTNRSNLCIKASCSLPVGGLKKTSFQFIFTADIWPRRRLMRQKEKYITPNSLLFSAFTVSLWNTYSTRVHL